MLQPSSQEGLSRKTELTNETASEIMKRVASVSEALVIKCDLINKFLTASFKDGSRNDSQQSRKIICNSKMVSLKSVKSKRSIGPDNKYHSVDSSFKTSKNSLKGFEPKVRAKNTNQNSRNHSNYKNENVFVHLPTSDLVKVKERKTYEPKSKLMKDKQTKSKKTLHLLSYATSMDEKNFVTHISKKKSPSIRYNINLFAGSITKIFALNLIEGL